MANPYFIEMVERNRDDRDRGEKLTGTEGADGERKAPEKIVMNGNCYMKVGDG